MATSTKKRSGLLNYFTVDSVDESHSNRNICSNKFSRGGKDAGSYGPSAIANHLRAKHPVQHNEYKKECSQSALEAASRKRSSCDESSSASSEPQLKQPTFSGFDDLKKPFDPSDPKQLKITRLIGEMLVLDIQPFSIVGDDSFKQLVHFMEPRYHMPDRTHFLRRVIPDLYDEVASNLQSEVRLEA